MDKLTVLMADRRSRTYIDLIRQRTPPGFELVAPETGDEAELIDLVGRSDVLLFRNRKIGREVIEAGPHLKLIQKLGVTKDAVDLEAAGEVGIPVAGMPLAGSRAVAELTWALLLALSKNILSANQSVVDAEYQSFGLEPKPTSETSIAFQWMQIPVVELFGTTLGIVGLGEIGIEVAKRARSFDMTVLYYKRRQLLNQDERDLGVQYRPLDELLQEADFVSLHIPHTSQTEELIGPRELALMKSSAYLINTCRGGVVDEGALTSALESDTIAGAGLDVFQEEPLPVTSPLRRLENVVLTPHIGGGSGKPNLEKEIDDVFENIDRVVRGEAPMHLFT